MKDECCGEGGKIEPVVEKDSQSSACWKPMCSGIWSDRAPATFFFCLSSLSVKLT